MTITFEWLKSPQDVFVPGLRRYILTVESAIEQLAAFYAPQIEAWMKTEARWVDQTGNARQALHIEVEQLTHEVVIHIAHGVDYGVYLEFGFAGRYSIIGPALDTWSLQLWNAIRAMLS